MVFGLLFEGRVKDQPGTPVGTENSTLQTVDLPGETGENSGGVSDTQQPIDSGTKPVIVKFKVRVGPYKNRVEAMAASQQLESLGYPVYVGNNPPFAVQVGAFAAKSNADNLKSELTGKGYKVLVDQD